MNRYDAIRGAIEEADPWLKEPGNHQLLHCLAMGVEAGLSWQPEEPKMPAPREGQISRLPGDTRYELLTENQVLANQVLVGPSREQYLQDRLDAVLLYLHRETGWVNANDVDGLVEIRHLKAAAMEILSEWREEKGLK